MTAAAVTGPAKLTESGIPIRNVWYMLLYTWGQQLSREKWRAEVEAAPTLDALLARILAAELEQRLRIGLGREYVTASSRLRGIRGKIDFPESLRKQLFDRGEAHCHYQMFAVDAPRNQIIKSILVRLIGTGDFSGGNPGAANNLRQRLRRLVRDLDGVNVVELTPQLIRRQQLGRNDRDYELMLNICLFLLERSLLTEEAGSAASLKADRDALQLSTVFEQFVAAFYRHHLHGWNVNPQKRLAWPTTDFVPYLPGMMADLVLTSPAGEMLVLDTKFTARSLLPTWGGALRFVSGHLYQLYTYLRTQENHSAAHARASGILLYPTVQEKLSEAFIVQGHEMRIETVDLAGEWENIENELLTIVGVR